MSGVTGAVIGGAVVGAGASIYSANKSAGAVSDASKAGNSEIARQYDQTRADFAPYRAAGVGALDKLSRLYGLGTSSAVAAADTRQAGGQRFKPSEIVKLKGQGLSVDDIIGLGYLGGEGDKELSYLMDQGFTSDDISRIQQGKFSAPATIDGATGKVINDTPDMSVFTESPDYQFNLAEGQKAIDRSLAARGKSLSGAGVRAGVRYASGMASTEFGNFYNRLASIAGLGQSATGSTAAAGSNASSQIGANLVNAGNARASSYAAGVQGVSNAITGGISNYALLQYLKPGP